MDKQDQFFEDPGLEGPDYVALVIEWDTLADQIENEITERTAQPAVQTFEPMRWLIGAALGVVGLIGATWAFRHFRAA